MNSQSIRTLLINMGFQADGAFHFHIERNGVKVDLTRIHNKNSDTPAFSYYLTSETENLKGIFYVINKELFVNSINSRIMFRLNQTEEDISIPFELPPLLSVI